MSEIEKQEIYIDEHAIALNNSTPDFFDNMIGIGNYLDTIHFEVELKTYEDFMKLIEPVRKAILPGNPPSPSMPIFYNFNRNILELYGLAKLKRCTIIKLKLIMKSKEEYDAIIKRFKIKGYILIQGNLKFG